MAARGLQDAIGFRGEKVVELCLTEYESSASPLFWPAFLGDKWPAVDFYIELEGVRGKRPFFFVQVKSTRSSITPKGLPLRVQPKDVMRLLRIPGPTYILGVHEPSQRVFVKSVHAGVPRKAITRIELTHELTDRNLKKLHREVREYWDSTTHKPNGSMFA